MDVNLYLDKDKTRAFLKEQYQLRKEIIEGNKTWEDMAELRKKYHLPELTKDSLRRSFGVFDSYLSEGLINGNDEDTCDSSDNNNRNSDITDAFVNTYGNKNTTIEFNAEKGITSSNKIVQLKEEELNDPKALLLAHGFDPKKFILTYAKSSIWQVAKKEGLKDLYSSKISVKPIDADLDIEEILKEFQSYSIEHSKEWENIYNGYEYSSYDENTIEYLNYSESSNQWLVPNLVDLHYGLNCVADEVGEDYNCEIAKRKILSVINSFVNRFKDRYFKGIKLVIGQDFFNSAYNGFTSSGRHKQDNDGSYKQIFKTGVETMIEIIEKFSTLAPTEVILVEGNHDRMEELFAVMILNAYFKDSHRVTVDDSCSTRKYRQIGNVALGFTHGSEEEKRLYSLMQIEQKELWANTKQHIWITGHLHHLEMKEDQGVEIWTCPTVVSPSSWTNQKGFVSTKRVSSFIIDEQQGLTSVEFVNLF